MQFEKYKIIFGHLYWIIVAVLAAIIVGAILILLIGINPLVAYSALIKGAFGTRYAVSETLVKAIPMILTGLAVSFAYKCKLVNLGAEGQLFMGAIFATWMGLSVGNIPSLLTIVLLSIGAFAAGAIYAFIPGILKAKLNVNEIIIGLMLNFLALYILSYLVEGPWKEPGSLIPKSSTIAESAQLPRFLGGGNRLHIYLFIAIILAILIHIIYTRTTLGFKLNVIGVENKVAEFSGINISIYKVVAMAVSGGLAGLAGYCEVGGVYHFLIAGISPGYGYFGFVVAFLAQLNPIGILFSGVFFSILLVGGESMQRTVGVPVVLIQVIQGLILFFVIGISIYLQRNELRNK